jgi:serine protease AprX
MLDGMQWIYDHKDTYNIRVVNISLTDSVVESYNVSPLDAAVERLWQRGIVVVVAAGNGGRSPQSLAAPGNDPFVITVGAADDQGTSSPYDDTVASWSSSGTTVDGFAKPDLVAPGVDLLAPLPVPNTYLAQAYPQNLVTTSNGSQAFRMSGTSVAAPIVAGAVALLLQDEPWLTPNQVKYRLIRTARSMNGATGSGAGMLNISSAVQSDWLFSSANGGISFSATIAYLTSAIGTTAKWSTAKWSTAKWSTAKWSTIHP